MIASQLRLGCELNYKVSGPSAFIFNVSVINNSFQRIVAEEFTTEAAIACRGIAFADRRKTAPPFHRCRRTLVPALLGDDRVVTSYSAGGECAGNAAGRVAG